MEKNAHEFLLFLLKNVAASIKTLAKPFMQNDADRSVNRGAKRRFRDVVDGSSPRSKKRVGPMNMNWLALTGTNKG